MPIPRKFCFLANKLLDLSLEPRYSAESLGKFRFLTISSSALWDNGLGSSLVSGWRKCVFCVSGSELLDEDFTTSGGDGIGTSDPWGIGIMGEGMFLVFAL